MKFRDLTELAGRNLREAVLRNSLTTLGIGVGVASLVAMLSLGVGLQELASKRLSRSGLFNAVFVASRANFRGGQGPGRKQPPAPQQPARPLDEDARRELAALPNVVEAYPEIRFPVEARVGEISVPTIVASIPPSARSSGAYDGMKGSFFSAPDAAETILQVEAAKEFSEKPEELLGKDLIIRYLERQQSQSPPPEGKPTDAPAKREGPSGSPGGPPQVPPGMAMLPREVHLRVVGLVETEPAVGFGGVGGGRVLVPLDLALSLHVAQGSDLREILRNGFVKPSYPAVTVRVKNPADVGGVEAKIREMGFAAFSLLDITKGLKVVFAVFDLLLGLFGSLALAVASLGIVNTLVMAILERRREIGVLKALGAADGDVRRLFFAEAGAMGLLGGALGVALGWLIGRGLTFGANVYLHRQDLPSVQLSSVPWWMVGGAILFSLLVSLVAGIFPASRAARLNPVEALRYE
ncbi:MAG TPA: ABC transporter permease [Methylomirabilota bacterium]|nr:ABC transporter permease [Methylomirabilota bacterium]